MKRNMTGIFRTVALLIAGALLLLRASRCDGCFSIVVGKQASTDGFVIMAHNEDDAPPQIVHHRKVPRKRYSPGEKVTLRNGGLLDQVEQTWAYIWSEMPGMLFSDSYINEWGVGVTSDNCPSREDKPEITDGGIGYMLRRLVAERAKTARQGILLAGELVEKVEQRGYLIDGERRPGLLTVPKRGVGNEEGPCRMNGNDGKVEIYPRHFRIRENVA